MGPTVPTLWHAFGFVQNELMLFALIWFLVIGADEIALDLGWMMRAVFREVTIYRRHQKATVAELAQPARSPRFAIFIPVWKESAIVCATISRTLEAYHEHHVTIFVGCYPNDDATLRAAASLACDRVVIAVNPQQGPTTKADNLNVLWRAMLVRERTAQPYDAVVLHDAEDHPDPEEPLVFSALLGRFAMIHLPVIPFASSATRWVGNHYCDEFAEAHLKAMVLREAIGAGLPSAGVGCAIRRDLLSGLDRRRPGAPFDPESLTEDYELGLAAKVLALPSAFVRVKRKDGLHLVATRSRFPDRFWNAVVQKSRWILGISIAGWDRIGWSGGLSEVWMRLRDRKAPISALAILIGYLSLTMAAIGFFASMSGVEAARPAFGSAVQILLAVATAMAVWRVAMRFSCVSYTYGVREGLWSVPRMLVCNFIAVCAAGRAMAKFVTMSRTGRLVWEKTDHSGAAEPATITS